MKKNYLLLISLLLLNVITYADNYPRNKDINILHYTFNLSLSDTSNEIFGYALVEIEFQKDSVKYFSLDLANDSKSRSHKGMKVSFVRNKNTSLNFEHKNNKLKIFLGTSSSKHEIRTFAIKYQGIPTDGLIISKNKFGDRTFFGDNWPNRAHYWLPCIDHPYDKATCDFIITAPSRYQVIANGFLAGKTDMGNGFRKTHWKEDVPISTKIMTIGVAKFSVQNLYNLKSLPVESWVYPQDSTKGFYDFRPAPAIIKFFENYIGPFPFKKLANVESTTQFDGMENAGSIFYNQYSITGKRTNEVTMAHEIAHQWFGDAVTEADWNHIWLSEGFATFFQNVFVKHQFGADSLLNVLRRERKQIFAYNFYRPYEAVVDTNITNLKNLLNINSYYKAAYVLRMLRHIMGEEKFWEGIKFYYKTYRNKNVLTSDFEKAMEHVYGKTLNWFLNEWIYKPGMPIILGSWHFNKDEKTIQIKLEQVQQTKEIFKLPIDLVIYSNNNSKLKNEILEIDKKENRFKFKVNMKPDAVRLDPNLWVLMQAQFSEK